MRHLLLNPHGLASMDSTVSWPASHNAHSRSQFLDDDDVWLPTKLEVQLEAMARDRSLVLVSSDALYPSKAAAARCRGGSYVPWPMPPQLHDVTARGTFKPWNRGLYRKSLTKMFGGEPGAAPAVPTRRAAGCRPRPLRRQPRRQSLCSANHFAPPTTFVTPPTLHRPGVPSRATALTPPSRGSTVVHVLQHQPRRPGSIPERVSLRAMERHNIFILSATMVTREALLDAGGFDESMAINEDIDLWLRVIRQNGPQLAMAAPLVIYDSSHGEASCQTAPRREGAS